MNQNDCERLQAGARILGVELSEKMISQFNRYAQMLEDWNSRMNLTSVPAQEVVPLHFLDSLTALNEEMSSGGRLVDVGTGAGLPGLPLKLVHPALEVTLMDSTRKRLDFLQAVIDELELEGIHVCHMRAEDAGKDPVHRQRYRFVTARAVSRMNVLVEWLLPLLKVGGEMIALKSAGAEEEIKGASKAIYILGGEPPRITPILVPGTDIERKVVRIRKIVSTPPAYPRMGGEIKSNPL